MRYVGTFALPPGFDTKQNNSEFSFGISNIIVDTTVDENGKVTPASTSQHSVNNSYFYNMTIKYDKIPKGGVASGGEKATFSATVLATALSQSGFDTDGITNAPAKDLIPGQSASRNIQVSYNLSGVAYEDRASVVFVLDMNNSFGTISGRSAK